MTILLKVLNLLQKTELGYRATFKISELINRVNAKLAKTRIIKFLNEQYPYMKVVMYDLGAAGGIEQVYRYLGGLNNFSLIGFEPDEKEVEHLKQSSEISIYPFAIGGDKGSRKLFITNFSHCSSLYPPNEDIIKDYPCADFFKIIKVQEIEVISIDEFLKENEVAKPDFLKLDVQGAEYEVLRGGSSVIKNSVIGIYLETHLRELYKGQGLFPDIHMMLLDLGFRLIYKSQSSPYFAGEVFELNVAYVRDIADLDNEERVVKAVLFCVSHRNLEFAAHLVRRSGLSNTKKLQLLKLLSKPLKPENIELILLKDRARQEGIFDSISREEEQEKI
jgi:FkbM family methyltransferase